MNEQNLYSYTQKGDHLTLYKGKKKVHTPNGNIVIASTEALAQRIASELEANADYTSCATALCYHYTYCDLIAQYDAATVADDLQNCCRDNIIDDPLLFFRTDVLQQADGDLDSIDEVALEQCSTAMLRSLSKLINTCTIHQLVAIIVIYCSFESLALSWHIINQLLSGNSAAIGSTDYESSKANLIADLKAYCSATEQSCPNNISDIIDAFAYYYTL